MLQVALDMIGKRGIMRPGVQRERRIKYAKDILQKELLPHIGIGPRCETKKVGHLWAGTHAEARPLPSLIAGVGGRPFLLGTWCTAL
jgi:hypothetical protein